MAIASKGPSRPEVGGNSELVPLKEENKVGAGRGGGSRIMELLLLEDMGRNCQTRILWFRREILRNRNNLPQKAKSIFPLGSDVPKNCFQMPDFMEGEKKRQRGKGVGREGMNQQQKNNERKVPYISSEEITFFFLFIFFLLKDNCFTDFCCFLSNINRNQP